MCLDFITSPSRLNFLLFLFSFLLCIRKKVIPFVLCAQNINRCIQNSFYSTLRIRVFYFCYFKNNSFNIWQIFCWSDSNKVNKNIPSVAMTYKFYLLTQYPQNISCRLPNISELYAMNRFLPASFILSSLETQNIQF